MAVHPVDMPVEPASAPTQLTRVCAYAQLVGREPAAALDAGSSPAVALDFGSSPAADDKDPEHAQVQIALHAHGYNMCVV